MPNIKSAKKRVLVSAAKTANNQAAKTALKTCIKKCNASLTSGDNMECSLKAAFKNIDQAASKGIIHKNTAARKKSALAKKYNAAVNA